MKIIGKIFLGFIGLVVLAGIGGYVIFLKPASASAVCKNFFAITKTELKQKAGVDYDQATLEKMSKMTLKECVDDTAKNQKPGNSGLLMVKYKADCEAQAKTIKEFSGCYNTAKAKIGDR